MQQAQEVEEEEVLAAADLEDRGVLEALEGVVLEEVVLFRRLILTGDHQAVGILLGRTLVGGCAVEISTRVRAVV